MRRSRRMGMGICCGAAAVAAVFVYGLAQQAYWALAIPVAMGVFSALSLSFWIGYTIITVRGIPAEAEQYQGRMAKLAAGAISAVSVVLATVFLIAVLEQSYWALAIPVAIAVLGLAGMVFWIGWAIVTQKSTLARPQAAESGENAAGADGSSNIPASKLLASNHPASQMQAAEKQAPKMQPHSPR